MIQIKIIFLKKAENDKSFLKNQSTNVINKLKLSQAQMAV